MKQNKNCKHCRYVCCTGDLIIGAANETGYYLCVRNLISGYVAFRLFFGHIHSNLTGHCNTHTLDCKCTLCEYISYNLHNLMNKIEIDCWLNRITDGNV